MRNSPLKFLTVFVSVACALLLTGVISSAARQARSSASQAVEQKNQAERINEQKFASLMSSVGVQADLSNRVSPGETYRSLRLQIVTNSEATAPNNSARTFLTSVNADQARTGELPRYRSFELSSQHLVVVTVDGTNRLRWWSLIPDPRILRAEEPDASGRLSGRVIYQGNVEVVLEIPDDATANELRFYHPQWTDGRVALVLVSTVALHKN